MSEKRFTSFIEDDGYWIRDESDFKIIATGLKLGVALNLRAYLNELNDENKTLKKENDDLRTTITKQVGAITEMKDLLYMFADLRIFDYSSEIEEDMQELKKAYDGTLEDFLKYFKED